MERSESKVERQFKNDFNIKQMPLMIGMIDAIIDDKKFVINWNDIQ